MLAIRARIHKRLVRIANRQIPDQTGSSEAVWSGSALFVLLEEPVWAVCLAFMLRLHYVPCGHSSQDFGHRGRNGVTVTQRRGTGSTNVARRGCRDRRDRFLNSQKICHFIHRGIDLLKCALVEREEHKKTWPNVTDLNTTWSMSIAGQLVTRQQPKVCQGLSSSVAVWHVLLTRPRSSNLKMESTNLRKMHLKRKVVTRVEIIITECICVRTSISVRN